LEDAKLLAVGIGDLLAVDGCDLRNGDLANISIGVFDLDGLFATKRLLFFLESCLGIFDGDSRTVRKGDGVAGGYRL
jgi:hypothetical protein